MSSYFVAATGNNSNNGLSAGAPFLTVAHAFSVAVNGDTISLNGGDSFAENLAGIAIGVTLTSYGTGRGTLAGTSASDTIQFLNWTTSASINIVNVAISNAAHTGRLTLVFLVTDGATRSAGITIDGALITNGQQGINIGTTTSFTGSTNNILIQNSTITGCGQYGIVINTTNGNYNYSNVNINNCVITGITGFATASVSGIGIQLTGTTNTVAPNFIQNCTVSNCGASASGVSGNSGPTGMFPFNAKFVTMQHNVVHDIFAASDTGGDGMGVEIDFSNTSCTAIYNIVYNCQGAGIGFGSSTASGTHVLSNNIVINCASLATSTNACSVYMYNTGTCVIANNTVISYGTFSCVNALAGNLANKTFLNNIFICPPGVATANLPTGITGLIMDGNYHQSGDGTFLSTINGVNKTTLAAWLSATGFETSGVAAEHCHLVQPQPVPTALSGATGYAPMSGAPVINAGANMLGTYSITPLNDFLGNVWSQNSIGAIYVAGTPTTFAGALAALNPLLWFRLSDASGATAFYDQIPDCIPGVYTSCTTGSPSIVQGDGGLSVAFNGSTSVARVATISQSVTSVSWGAWFMPGVVTGTAFILDFNTANLLYVAQASAQILTNVSDGTNKLQVSTTNANLVVGTPYFVAVTHASGTSTVIVYINGVAATLGSYSLTGTGIPVTVPLGTASVGGPPSGATLFFTGSIQNAFVVSSVLTSGQVLALYQSGLAAIRARRTLTDRVGSRGIT